MDEEARFALMERHASGRTDRSEPVFFAGRKRELAWLEEGLACAMQGIEGVSSVVHGIPGSGKTALAREFCKRAAQERGVVVVTGSGGKFGSTTALVRAIAAAYLRDRAGRRARRVKETHEQVSTTAAVRVASEETIGAIRDFLKSGDLEFGVPGVVRRRKRRADPEDSEPLSTLLHRAAVPADEPIIVFVDEAQDMRTKFAKPLVQELHLGVDGRAILPLYCGTNRLEAKFRSMVSRPSGNAFLSIGSMPEEDAEASIDGACRTFGVPDHVRDELVPALARTTQGFPAHVGSAVGAVAQVMVDNGRVFPAGEVAECLAEARRRRSRYYDERLLSAGDPPLSLLAVLADASNGADDGWTPRDAVREEYARENAKLPKRDRHDLDALLADCENAGALRTRKRPADRAVFYQFVAPPLADEIRSRMAAG